MASTLLEQTRQFHEDMERLERLIVKDFKTEPKTHREKLLQGHRVKEMLETMQQRADRLVTIYEDTDNARKDEITSLRGDNVFQNFYDRLKETREYHRQFSSNDVLGPEDDTALLPSKPHIRFSGEEGFGKFLDLHELHQTWQNSKFGNTCEYSTYVSQLSTHLDDIPRAARLSGRYKQYIDDLLRYLISFFERTQPLAQLNKQMSKMEDEFENDWNAGEIPGWHDKGLGISSGNSGNSGGNNSNGNNNNDGDNTTTTNTTTNDTLDLDAFDSPEELEVLGADRLKSALMALGLKCGGTLRQRAERLFSTKGKKLEELHPSLFAKGSRPAAMLNEEEREKNIAHMKSIALIEYKIRKFCTIVSSVIADTLGRIEKRLAQTYEEILAEKEEEEQGEELLLDDEDEEEEDDYIYNPLKLPLGWDGKPIPYWMYKLHGLNLEFKCEICGGASYWGRRAFEKHFTEAQHQAGMKALGIPNTKQFFEVTSIADAVSLWKTLQDKKKGGFRDEEDEEYEDAEGNVFNKKVYMDLKRQGML